MAKTARTQHGGRQLLFGEYLRSWTNLNVGGAAGVRVKHSPSLAVDLSEKVGRESWNIVLCYSFVTEESLNPNFYVLF